MKRLSKKVLFLSFILFSFFVGINNTKALTCEYKLPFSGIDASSGKHVNPNSNLRCYQRAGLHYCSVTASLNSKFFSSIQCNAKNFLDFGAYIEGEWNDILTPAGYSISAPAGKTGSFTTFYSYKMLGTDGSKDDTSEVAGSHVKTVIKSNEKCPKYIIVQKTSNNVFIQNSDLYEKIFSDSGQASGNSCTEGDDANIITPISFDSNGKKDKYYMLYQGSSDDNAYRTFLKSFYKISTSSSGSDSVSVSNLNLNYYILPYYTKTYSGESQIAQVEDAKTGARVYVETFDKAWYNKMVSFQKKLESDCGSDWYSYINRKNYGIGSSDLFDYAEGTYSSGNLKTNDKNISKKCWNTRKDFFKAFESLQLFMYGMGANTITEFENMSNISADTIEEYTAKLKKANVTDAQSQNLYYRVYLEDDTRVQHFKYLLYFFEGVKIGTTFTPETFRSSANELVNEKSDSQYRIKVLKADQCAYTCSNVEDSTNYEKCKNSNASYKKCLTALVKCNAKVCTNCIDKEYGTEFDKCMKSCPTVDGDCMESNGISGFKEESKAKLDAAETAKSELDKAAEYTYEPASLPVITFKTKKYTPNCKDIKVFTYIYSIGSYLAPFFIIIFGAFDYFKAVMASNEEKIREAKKKFPLRLIAFLILLIAPVLIKIVVEKFGTNRANDVTYIRCIATQDYGD